MNTGPAGANRTSIRAPAAACVDLLARPARGAEVAVLRAGERPQALAQGQRPEQVTVANPGAVRRSAPVPAASRPSAALEAEHLGSMVMLEVEVRVDERLHEGQ